MSEQRIRFRKEGVGRYISHLDLMRTFQRSFLRAGIRIRHTEGFNPHAYVSIPLPLSVGFSSDCEIMEFGLESDLPLDEVPVRLNGALPAGIVVERCYNAVIPYKRLGYVNYIVELRYDAVPAGAAEQIKALLSRKSWVVRKRSGKAKSGFVEVDLIPLIRSTELEEREGAIRIDWLLRAQNPGLNPQVIIDAILAECPGLTPAAVTYHRKEVYTDDLKPFE